MMEMREHVQTPKNLEIEALRGVAILGVLFAHIGVYLFPGSSTKIYEASRYWVQPGTGVDLFFCISGYVITSHYVSRAPTARKWAAFYSFAIPFWIRRFWRLAPSAWLWLVLGLIILACSGAAIENSVKDAIAAVLQVANFHIYECINRINATSCGSFTIYWSLSLEEQFYIAFPILLFVLPMRFLVPFFCVLFILQFFLPRSLGGLMWFIRTDAIALGVLIALMQQSQAFLMIRPAFLDTRIARWMWALTLVALLFCLDSPRVHFVEFTVGMVAVISAALVWTASYNRNYLTPVEWLKSVLVFVGARSYGLYVIHGPASVLTIMTLNSIFGEGGFHSVYKLLVFPVVFGIAELNYRLIEVPLRKHGAEVAARFGGGLAPESSAHSTRTAI